METKILITVEGGIVQSVCASNPDVRIMIIDYDKHSDEPVSVSGKYEPDGVFENMAEEAFTGELTENEKFAQDELKKQNF